MSADHRYLFFITEGIHDLMVIGRFLKLMGFVTVKSIDKVPNDVLALIPKSYPFDEDNRLSWVVPCPSFYLRDNLCVVIKQGNGSSMISGFCNAIDTLRREALRKISSVAFIADADNATPEEKTKALIHGIAKAFEKMDSVTLSGNGGEIELYGCHIPCSYYILPDNNSCGTVEELLLQGAEIAYQDLAKAAGEYIDAIPSGYKATWKPYDSRKARVGVIANALKPGKANQVSIHDNDWVCESTIEKSDSMKKLKSFIETLIEQVNEVRA